MKKVGLTGGIGSGKSTVCRVFSQLGAPVYDSDMMAKRLMEQEQGLIDELKKLLGNESYSGSRLNREYVAKQIFADKELLQRMNAIVHPAVMKDFLRWAQCYDVPYVIFESAILFESGLFGMFDSTVTVCAPQKLRIERILKRDAVALDNIEARLANQIDDKQRELLADHIIVNDDHSLVVPQILALDKKLCDEIS